MIAPVAQRIEHLTTDQKVRGSNPCGRTQQNSRSDALTPIAFAPGNRLLSTKVSNSVCNPLKSFLCSCLNLQLWLHIDFKPRLLVGIQNMLIIIYQRIPLMNVLILDKSSQDLFLSGDLIGNKISLFRSRCLPSSFNVAFKFESTTQSKPNSLFKRRSNAQNSCYRYKSIYQPIMQRNNEWRQRLSYAK